VYARRFSIRCLAAYGTIATFVCLFLTQSRGALVSLIFMSVVTLFVLDRRVARRLAVVFVLVSLAVATLFSESLLERFGTILHLADADAGLDASVQGRLAQWIVAVKLFLDNPMLGVGAGNFAVPFQDYSLDLGLMFRGGHTRAAHSLYLQILAERGVLGFGLFVAILIFAVRGILRAATMAAAPDLSDIKGRYLFLGLGLSGYLTAMVFLHDAYPRLMWTMLAIAIALPRIAPVEIGARVDDK
jgi:O-antigen ligase